MVALHDVVQLSDGSVGVVSDAENAPVEDVWNVRFLDFRDALPASQLTVLSAPVFNVGDDVMVGDEFGTIASVDGDEFTVDVTRRVRIDEHTTANLDGQAVVPRWQIVLDNDTRITSRLFISG